MQTPTELAKWKKENPNGTQEDLLKWAIWAACNKENMAGPCIDIAASVAGEPGERALAQIAVLHPSLPEDLMDRCIAGTNDYGRRRIARQRSDITPAQRDACVPSRSDGTQMKDIIDEMRVAMPGTPELYWAEDNLDATIAEMGDFDINFAWVVAGGLSGLTDDQVIECAKATNMYGVSHIAEMRQDLSPWLVGHLIEFDSDEARFYLVKKHDITEDQMDRIITLTGAKFLHRIATECRGRLSPEQRDRIERAENAARNTKTPLEVVIAERRRHTRDIILGAVGLAALAAAAIIGIAAFFLT